jgi:hypothetical protein
MKLSALLLAGAALLVPLSPAAAAESPGGHCPPPGSGYQVWDVNTEPYGADNRVDEQGNNNGFVCAKPGKVVTDEDGQPFQLYNFIDDRGAAR